MGGTLTNCLIVCLRGRAVSFRVKLYSYWGRIASFPGRKVSNCRCLVMGGTLTNLIAYLIYWIYWVTWVVMVLLLLLLARLLLGELLPSGGGWPVAGGELSPSPGGRRAVAGVGLRALGGDWTNLFKIILLLILVIFPSFFVTKWLSLLICLCFTLVNLSSLTLLMKSWHCSNLSCEMIEASLSLQSCDSLSTCSKMLLIAFILACR